MPKTKKNQKKSPNVPGQYLGFSLQATRFLVKLLDSEPGCTVSLEVFEDVGTESLKLFHKQKALMTKILYLIEL